MIFLVKKIRDSALQLVTINVEDLFKITLLEKGLQKA